MPKFALVYMVQLKEARMFLLNMRSEFEAETGSDLYIPVNDVLDRILTCWSATG